MWLLQIRLISKHVFHFYANPVFRAQHESGSEAEAAEAQKLFSNQGIISAERVFQSPPMINIDVRRISHSLSLLFVRTLSFSLTHTPTHTISFFTHALSHFFAHTHTTSFLFSRTLSLFLFLTQSLHHFCFSHGLKLSVKFLLPFWPFLHLIPSFSPTLIF